MPPGKGKFPRRILTNGSSVVMVKQLALPLMWLDCSYSLSALMQCNSMAFEWQVCCVYAPSGLPLLVGVLTLEMANSLFLLPLNPINFPFPVLLPVKLFF